MMLPIAQISLTVSVYSTVGVAVERFISVCIPHSQVSPRFSLHISFAIVGFSILINVSRFFEYTVEKLEVPAELLGFDPDIGNISIFRPRPSELRLDPTYSKVMTVLSLTLLHIVPLVSLTYLNYAII